MKLKERMASDYIAKTFRDSRGYMLLAVGPSRDAYLAGFQARGILDDDTASIWTCLCDEDLRCLRCSIMSDIRDLDDKEDDKP